MLEDRRLLSILASYVTKSSALVSWDASPDPSVTYQVQYREHGAILEGAWTPAIPLTTSNTTTAISGLTANTVYDVQERTVDSGGTPGTWVSQEQVFTTAYDLGVADASNDSVMAPFHSLGSGDTEDRFEFTLQNTTDDFSLRFKPTGNATVQLLDSGGAPVSGIPTRPLCAASPEIFRCERKLVVATPSAV
jgi:hypothetical protein